MSDSTAMSKFEKFRNEYSDRQVGRPRLRPTSTERLQIEAAEDARESLRRLEQFFCGLTTDEKDEILEELDMTDSLNSAIIQQARELFLMKG
jgi:hypothetical protein